MLAKKFRLQVGKWIKDKTKKAVAKKSSFFILKTSLNNLIFSRFGVVVSSKVAESAVKRNQLKRTIFDFIRLEKLYEIPPPKARLAHTGGGKDFLIIVLPPITKLTKIEIKKELKTILQL